MMPCRIRLSRQRGWRMPPNTVSVARPTKWGNPHVIVLDDMRWDGETYDDNGDPVLHGPWLCKLQPDRLSGWWFPTREQAIAKSVEFYRWSLEQGPRGRDLRTRLGEIRGKNLACWCKLGTPCHADVLLELANR